MCVCVYAVLPRKGTQVILYPEAPGVLLHDKVKKFMPMSTTFTPLTAGIGSESETAAEKTKTKKKTQGCNLSLHVHHILGYFKLCGGLF